MATDSFSGNLNFFNHIHNAMFGISDKLGNNEILRSLSDKNFTDFRSLPNTYDLALLIMSKVNCLMIFKSSFLFPFGKSTFLFSCLISCLTCVGLGGEGLREISCFKSAL